MVSSGAMSSGEPRIGSDVAEVVTVGLPFCVFKGLVGALFWRSGYPVPGAVLLALCLSDSLINLVNLGALVFWRRRALSACTLAVIVLRLRVFATSPNEYVKDLGNSLDMLLSFTLVAAMVGLGKIPSFPPEHLRIWNGAVVLQVLGAGLSRVGASFRSLPRGR